MKIKYKKSHLSQNLMYGLSGPVLIVIGSFFFLDNMKYTLILVGIPFILVLFALYYRRFQYVQINHNTVILYGHPFRIERIPVPEIRSVRKHAGKYILSTSKKNLKLIPVL